MRFRGEPRPPEESPYTKKREQSVKSPQHDDEEKRAFCDLSPHPHTLGPELPFFKPQDAF